ncbi:CehA/McbA family metallohydrolase [Lentzea sp.]|uniref:CehA/McbA family metallohydrolase n=1 Tax=Lentzea sp. TaxID=56099 RepID=UPI002CD00A32|nr:CehA/McbA family metallohydrolase [Lentzea sp.]HUQ55158.1 CehA/McbA family metallohydrolase [Lentzea sp.]
MSGDQTPALLIGKQTGPVERDRSRLFPGVPERLLHADLHNHTLFSDGAGSAEDAYSTMRKAGLDVAAVTDHAYGISAPEKTIDDASWRKLGSIADAADAPGEFVAIRGFEWSSPSLGHMNVWGSGTWTEPLPLSADGVPGHLAIGDPGPPDDPAAIAEFYDWLRADPDRREKGGGRDGLIGFNHPGREAGRFGFFRYDHELAGRVVAFEMFNRDEDYLFEGVDTGMPSPLVECLDAGWRVGLVGVTDEHSTDWGFPEGLGRTGLWTRGRSRPAVREAMLRRRMFATRERGLLVDGAANGQAMGTPLAVDRAEVRIVVHFDGGADWIGHPLRLQVLRTGRPLPTVVGELDFTVSQDGLVSLKVWLEREAGDWVVVRISDPARPADRRAASFADYRSAGHTVAYLSPFFLVPGRVL